MTPLESIATRLSADAEYWTERDESPERTLTFHTVEARTDEVLFGVSAHQNIIHAFDDDEHGHIVRQWTALAHILTHDHGRAHGVAQSLDCGEAMTEAVAKCWAMMREST